MKHTISIFLIMGAILSFVNAQELYKNCSTCHGEHGELEALHKSKLIGGQDVNLTIKQLTAYKDGELNQYGLGNIMNKQVETLSEDDIEELANYIATLQPKVD